MADRTVADIITDECIHDDADLATLQAMLDENERLREALRDLADAYRGIALNHPTVVTRHLPLIMAEEVLFGSDDRG